MKNMQIDLYRMFGYDAVVEEREMPVMRLVATDAAKNKLKTRGGTPFNSQETLGNAHSGFSLRNKKPTFLMSYLITYVNEIEKEVFIDATGITDNIDFSITADLTDIADIKRQLKKQGLDFVAGTKKMKVLVIRDPRN